MRLLIIVSGAGSLALALNLANEAMKPKWPFLVKRHLVKRYLQVVLPLIRKAGLPAAVMGATEDSVELHVQDTLTLNAEGGLCDPDVLQATYFISS